jgi:hypothetical protein
MENLPNLEQAIRKIVIDEILKMVNGRIEIEALAPIKIHSLESGSDYKIRAKKHSELLLEAGMTKSDISRLTGCKSTSGFYRIARGKISRKFALNIEKLAKKKGVI